MNELIKLLSEFNLIEVLQNHLGDVAGVVRRLSHLSDDVKSQLYDKITEVFEATSCFTKPVSEASEDVRRSWDYVAQWLSDFTNQPRQAGRIGGPTNE